MMDTIKHLYSNKEILNIVNELFISFQKQGVCFVEYEGDVGDFETYDIEQIFVLYNKVRWHSSNGATFQLLDLDLSVSIPDQLDSQFFFYIPLVWEEYTGIFIK